MLFHYLKILVISPASGLILECGCLNPSRSYESADKSIEDMRRSTVYCGGYR